MDQVIKFFVDNPYLTIIGATCIIQIAPIKINPWTKLIKWIGNCLNSDLGKKITELEGKIEELEDKVIDMDRDISEERVKQKRWAILDFTNSCRQGHSHTREEWDHCIDELSWYEQYCEDHDIPNGVIEQSSAWLNERYQKHLENDDFIKD